MPLPERDEMFNTKGKMLQDITVSLGGRVAEEEVFDDITTGASQDIKQATGSGKIHGYKVRYVRRDRTGQVMIMTTMKYLSDATWHTHPEVMARVLQL